MWKILLEPIYIPALYNGVHSKPITGNGTHFELIWSHQYNTQYTYKPSDYRNLHILLKKTSELMLKYEAAKAMPIKEHSHNLQVDYTVYIFTL